MPLDSLLRSGSATPRRPHLLGLLVIPLGLLAYACTGGGDRGTPVTPLGQVRLFGGNGSGLVSFQAGGGPTTTVVPRMVRSPLGAAFDPGRGVIVSAQLLDVSAAYPVETVLLSVDAGSGSAGWVASVGASLENGLARSDAGVVFAIDAEGAMLEIDASDVAVAISDRGTPYPGVVTGDTQILGMAYDDEAARVLVLVQMQSGVAIDSIDPVSGEMQQLAGPSVVPATARGLAVDPVRGVAFLAVDDGTLRQVDLETGALTAVAGINTVPSSVVDLAHDPASDALVVVDAEGGLTRFELASNTQGISWPISFGVVDAVASGDPVRGTVAYFVERGRGTVFARLLEGVVVVGTFDRPGIGGLAYAGDGVLYASDVQRDELLTMDVDTGAASVVGPLGFGAVEGLAWDPVRGGGALYGTDTSTGMLLIVDHTAGSAYPIGLLPSRNVEGLGWDPRAGALVGADSDAAVLMRIEPLSGRARESVRLTAPIRGVGGLAPVHYL